MQVKTGEFQFIHDLSLSLSLALEMVLSIVKHGTSTKQTYIKKKTLALEIA